MAKITGTIVEKVLVQDVGASPSGGKRAGTKAYNIAKDIASYSINDGQATIDQTSVGDFTTTRQAGKADFTVQLTGFIDPDAVPAVNAGDAGDDAPAYGALINQSQTNRRLRFQFGIEVGTTESGKQAYYHPAMILTDSGVTNDAQGNLMWTATLVSGGGDAVRGTTLGNDFSIS